MITHESHLDQNKAQFIKSEMLLLAMMLIDKDVFFQTSDCITIKDFLSEKHQSLYAAIKELYATRIEITIHSIIDVLQYHGKYSGFYDIQDVALYITALFEISETIDSELDRAVAANKLTSLMKSRKLLKENASKTISTTRKLTFVDDANRDSSLSNPKMHSNALPCMVNFRNL